MTAPYSAASAASPTPAAPRWSRYEDDEYMHRMAVVIEEVGHAFRSQGRVFDAERMKGEVTSWLHALELVPTAHLATAFSMAIGRWKEPYLMPASEVKLAYDEIHQERLLRSRTGTLDTGPKSGLLLLPAGAQGHAGHGGGAGQGQGGYWVLCSVYDERWYRSRKAPWQIYPQAENPYQRGEVVWWVDRCAEIDFPEIECPGWVTEHAGPGGKTERRLTCPMHSERRADPRFNKLDGEEPILTELERLAKAARDARVREQIGDQVE